MFFNRQVLVKGVRAVISIPSGIVMSSTKDAMLHDTGVGVIVSVGVFVDVLVFVLVGVLVDVLVIVLVDVFVDVLVNVLVDVYVDVGVRVAVGGVMTGVTGVAV